MRRAAEHLPRDARGRVLWERMPGFTDFFKAEGPQRTSLELRHLIEDRYHYLPTLSQVENLRRRLEVRMDPAVRRRAIDARDLAVEVAAEKIPSFVRELGPKDQEFFIHVNSPVVVSGDWHVPFVHQQMFDRLLQIAKHFEIRQLIIAGDFLDESAFSRWPHHRFNVNWDFEKASARLVLGRLYDVFETTVYVMSNHDRRIIVSNEKSGQFAEEDVIELLTYGVKMKKLRVSMAYDWVLVDNLWRVTAPKTYRQLKLSLPNRLAQLHHQHTITHGDHLWAVGLDDSAHYIIANGATMTDPAATPYINVRDTTHPLWGVGFYMIRNGVIQFFSNHPNLTDWKFWLGEER